MASIPSRTGSVERNTTETKIAIAVNLDGTGAYDVYRQAETTVTYAQTIERGGKRDARIAYAERDIAVWKPLIDKLGLASE